MQLLPPRDAAAVYREQRAAAAAAAEGAALARDLGNTPPNVATPDWLATRARSIATDAGHEDDGLPLAELRKMGMGGLVAVGEGSSHAPRLVRLEWGRRGPIVALVGKGVTFDTGGISIKPAADMDEMKYDKCGACNVLGAAHAVARLALPVRLRCYLPLAENMPSGSAYRPGDIIRCYNEKTVEITNTDAEGRLILADALALAVEERPDYIVEMSTLTGGAIVALGERAAALYCSEDAMAAALLAAADDAGERLWRMPLWPEYVAGDEGQPRRPQELVRPLGLGLHRRRLPLAVRRRPPALGAPRHRRARDLGAARGRPPATAWRSRCAGCRAWPARARPVDVARRCSRSRTSPSPSRWEAVAVDVVRSVSFDVDRGEMVGLVGESGSGKTMSALAVMRLVPAPGAITARRDPLRRAATSSRCPSARCAQVRGGRIAMVFQEPMTALNPVFTIGYQIVEALRAHRDVTRAAARREAERLLELVAMPDPQRRLDDYPHRLSGGQRQRAMIAMALACSPQVLLADEPTTALDVTIQAQILELLDRLRRELELAVLLITHDLSVVAETCDRVVVMYAGERGGGGAARRRSSPRRRIPTRAACSPRCRGWASRPSAASCRRSPARSPTPRERPPACAFHPRCPDVVRPLPARGAAAVRGAAPISGRAASCTRRP